MKGQMIIFEGGDGAGKSTLLRSLEAELCAQGRDVLATRDPGGSKKAEEIRRLLVEREPEDNFIAETQLLLFYASRFQNLRDTIVPKLEAGGIVLCDRFEVSAFAYQVHAHGGNVELFTTLHQAVVEMLQPERFLCTYVHCDIDPKIGRQRSLARNEGRVDVHDGAPLDFHLKVREGMFIAREYINPAFKHITINANLDQASMLVETREKLKI